MEVPQTMSAALHDAYAADYDAQVQTYDCHVAEVLFGLCYEFIQPGQRLLDVGIGSGISAQLFAKAGLEIYGMDFSPAMLDICRAKGFAADLKQHDLLQLPGRILPPGSMTWSAAVCCTSSPTWRVFLTRLSVCSWKTACSPSPPGIQLCWRPTQRATSGKS